MAAFVVYDSIFGNTAQVARAVAAALEAGGETVHLLTVDEAQADPIAEIDLLVLGSPTRGFRPTPAVQEFLAQLDGRLEGVAVAAFDTRIDPDDIHPAPLRWVVEVGGYAADVLAGRLRERGARVIGEPAGFMVGGTEGPLKDGELDRASAWAAGIAAAVRGSGGGTADINS